MIKKILNIDDQDLTIKTTSPLSPLLAKDATLRRGISLREKSLNLGEFQNLV